MPSTPVNISVEFQYVHAIYMCGIRSRHGGNGEHVSNLGQGLVDGKDLFGTGVQYTECRCRKVVSLKSRPSIVKVAWGLVSL
jgi:hypothetical protein